MRRRKRSEPTPTAQPAGRDEFEPVFGRSRDKNGDAITTYGARRKVPVPAEGFGRIVERDEEPEGLDLVDLIGRY